MYVCMYMCMCVYVLIGVSWCYSFYVLLSDNPLPRGLHMYVWTVCMYVCMYVTLRVLHFYCWHQSSITPQFLGYVCMHVFTHVCMYVCMYVVYVCMYDVCMYCWNFVVSGSEFSSHNVHISQKWTLWQCGPNLGASEEDFVGILILAILHKIENESLNLTQNRQKAYYLQPHWLT